MKIPLRLIVMALGCFAANAGAQAYPSRPIRFVVGYAPGGNIDVTARILASSFTEQFGKTVIVDNRPAVHGLISGSIVAKSAPDGYTLLVGSSGQMTTSDPPADMHYDYVKSFAPVGSAQISPYVMISTVKPPIAKLNLNELITYAKQRPGQVTIAHSGYGTRLVLELVNTMAGIKLLPVPYKGGAPALTDLIGGQVDTMMTQLAAATGAMRDNRVKGLAVTTLKRSSVAPGIPTFDESGLRGFEAGTFVGMIAPAGTPPAVIRTLNAAILRAVRTPAIQDKFREMGADTQETTPEQFGSMIRGDIVKWKKVAQAAGVQPDE